MSSDDEIEFGFCSFAPTVFAEFAPALRLAEVHSHFANEMIAALPATMKREEAVIYMLVRMTTNGWIELLILVGNGAGLGAMKIARGMFETAVMAEYLRRFPDEIDDYIHYWPILKLKRANSLPKVVSNEQLAKIRREVAKVKARYEDKNGRMRSQWNKHPISYMAEKVGRKDQYEVPYSLAASIHHGNFEALAAHMSGNASALDIDSPLSLQWIRQALVSGHIYLLQALDTMNDLLKLGFEDRLRIAGQEFGKVWEKSRNP